MKLLKDSTGNVIQPCASCTRCYKITDESNEIYTACRSSMCIHYSDYIAAEDWLIGQQEDTASSFPLLMMALGIITLVLVFLKAAKIFDLGWFWILLPEILCVLIIIFSLAHAILSEGKKK